MDKYILAEVAASNEQLVIDFYADWCGPCKAMEPILEQFTADTGILVAGVDIDNSPELAQEYDVMSIPTLVYLKEGVEVGRQIGAGPVDFPTD